MGQATLNRSPLEIAAGLAREIVGLIAGGFLGAATWMIVANEGFSRGWSEQNFPEALGEIRGAELTDIPRLGLWTGLVFGTLLAAVVLPVAYRVVPGPWYVRAIPLALIAFLIWGLWYSPAAGDHSSFPGGFFGADAGAGTVIVFAVTAAAYGAVAGRVYSVTVTRDFWRPKTNDLREQGAQVMEELGLEDDLGLEVEGEASLELAEERGGKRREAPEA